MKRAHNLVANYNENGVKTDKILMRLPATWQGIQAAKQLESEGIAAHVTLVYRCCLLRPWQSSAFHVPFNCACKSVRLCCCIVKLLSLMQIMTSSALRFLHTAIQQLGLCSVALTTLSPHEGMCTLTSFRFVKGMRVQFCPGSSCSSGRGECDPAQHWPHYGLVQAASRLHQEPAGECLPYSSRHTVLVWSFLCSQQSIPVSRASSQQSIGD